MLSLGILPTSNNVIASLFQPRTFCIHYQTPFDCLWATQDVIKQQEARGMSSTSVVQASLSYTSAVKLCTNSFCVRFIGCYGATSYLPNLPFKLPRKSSCDNQCVNLSKIVGWINLLLCLDWLALPWFGSIDMFGLTVHILTPISSSIALACSTLTTKNDGGRGETDPHWVHKDSSETASGSIRCALFSYNGANLWVQLTMKSICYCTRLSTNLATIATKTASVHHQVFTTRVFHQIITFVFSFGFHSCLTNIQYSMLFWSPLD